MDINNFLKKLIDDCYVSFDHNGIEWTCRVTQHDDKYTYFMFSEDFNDLMNKIKDKQTKIANLFKDIKKYVGYLCKIRVRDRDNLFSDYIGYITKYDEKYNCIFVSHPINFISGNMVSGESAYYFNNDINEINDITYITDNSILNEWISKYNDFHNDIIKNKGYDTCEINTDEVKIYLTK